MQGCALAAASLLGATEWLAAGGGVQILSDVEMAEH